jgi:hypothetical protein
MATHYVDNKKLYACIVEYRQLVLQAREQGTTRPIIPNYIGQCILMIANRLSTKPNFVNYSYREEMVSDGVENCICYIDNFDPLKSSNPFAYFTQIIYFAFLRRILKEKKQLYIKHKSLENSMILNELMAQSEFDEKDFTPSYIDVDNENMYDFIKTFEDNLLSKKKKRKKGIENFLEDEVVVEGDVIKIEEGDIPDIINPEK